MYACTLVASKTMKNPSSTTTKHSSHSTSPRSQSSFSSSSSSEFEFIISLSPTSRKSSLLCPADELFYKGQLLPLHLSSRLSMLHSLLYSSSSSSSSTRRSSASSDLSLLIDESARPSSASAADCDDLSKPPTSLHHPHHHKQPKPFSLSRFSSTFLRRDSNTTAPPPPSKKLSTSAKEVVKRYVKKVKPFYDKFTSKMASSNHSHCTTTAAAAAAFGGCSASASDAFEVGFGDDNCNRRQSFSGNLRYPRRRSSIVSCPPSMRSSPTHSGVLRRGSSSYGNSTSSMEELQSAIEGAITHCKNSMSEFSDKKGGGTGLAVAECY